MTDDELRALAEQRDLAAAEAALAQEREARAADRDSAAEAWTRLDAAYQQEPARIATEAEDQHDEARAHVKQDTLAELELLQNNFKLALEREGVLRSRLAAMERVREVPSEADKLGYTLAMAFLQSPLWEKASPDERAAADYFLEGFKAAVRRAVPEPEQMEQCASPALPSVPSHAAWLAAVAAARPGLPGETQGNIETAIDAALHAAYAAERMDAQDHLQRGKRRRPS